MTTDKIAPNWMATVKSLVNSSDAFPMMVDAIIMCPVEEIGRNSVNPSMMANTMASKKFISYVLGIDYASLSEGVSFFGRFIIA